MTQLYIPKKLKVGFQNREDTAGGRLGYIIYQDDKKVWRKEKSWEGWRDKTIDAEFFDNVPTSGFCLHKDVTRRGYEWFSETQVKIRIHDSRGFEFEITPANLTSILMHTDCLKRGLDGEFVYAWEGKELILLPVKSEEYSAAQEFTVDQSLSVKVKDLKPGFTYSTKKGKKYVYLGRYDWAAQPMMYPDSKKKSFIFIKEGQEENYHFDIRNSITHLSKCVSGDESPKFGEYSNILAERPEIKGVEITFEEVSAEDFINDNGGNYYWSRNVYYHNSPGSSLFVGWRKDAYSTTTDKVRRCAGYDFATKKFLNGYDSYSNYQFINDLALTGKFYKMILNGVHVKDIPYL